MINQTFNPYSPQTQPSDEVPQGLELLMQLAKVASPQGPAGPTVASQMMQRAQQPPQSPGMPPQGMPPQGPPQGPPGMMPNDPFRQQMMKTVQQQAQASAQPPQQPPQPPGPPQGMAHGGIASLRADNMARLKYAKGGVIGFNGAVSSYVDPMGASVQTDAEEGDKDKANKDAVRKLLAQLGMPLAAFADVTSLPMNALRQLTTHGGVSMTPAFDIIRRLQAEEAKPAVAEAARDFGRDPESLTPQQIEQLMKTTAASSGNQRLPGPSGAPRAPQTAPQAPAMQMPAAPTAQQQFDIARANVGIDPRIAEMEALAKQRAALAGQRPDIEGMNIAALQKADEERNALLARQREGDVFRRWGAFGGDLATRYSGNQLNTLDAAIAKRDQEAIDANKASQLMQIEQRKLAHAVKVNDIDAQLAIKEKLSNLDEKRMGHMINAANISQNISSGVYSSQMSFLSQRLHDRSQESMNAQRLAMQAGELGQNKLAQQLTAANHRVQTAETTVAKILHDEFGVSTKLWESDPKSAATDPNYQKYLKRKQELEERNLLPAMRLRQHLSNKILGDVGGQYSAADKIVGIPGG